jgi:hypothetical protein
VIKVLSDGTELIIALDPKFLAVVVDIWILGFDAGTPGV